MVLQTFATMATANAEPFTSHLGKLKQTAELQPTTLASVAKVHGAVGKLNQARPYELLLATESEIDCGAAVISLIKPVITLAAICLHVILLLETTVYLRSLQFQILVRRCERKPIRE